MKFPTLLEALDLIHLDPQIVEAWKGRQHDHIVSINKLKYFYSQPLALWMFVPCGEDGKPMVKPSKYDAWALNEYHVKKKRVLFKGWKHKSSSGLRTIVSDKGQSITFFEEDLTIRDGYSEISDEKIVIAKFVTHYDLTPTQSAKDQLNIKED